MVTDKPAQLRHAIALMLEAGHAYAANRPDWAYYVRMSWHARRDDAPCTAWRPTTASQVATRNRCDARGRARLRGQPAGLSILCAHVVSYAKGDAPYTALRPTNASPVATCTRCAFRAVCREETLPTRNCNKETARLQQAATAMLEAGHAYTANRPD